MKTAVLCFACLPLVLTGFLLESSFHAVDRELAYGSKTNSDTSCQMDDSQSSSARAQIVLPGYGDISGQILFEGEVPAPKVLFKQDDPRIKDAATCAAHDVIANDLLVDPKTKGVANAFVYIYHRYIKKHGIKVHPDLVDLKESEREIVFRQKNCRFIPHVMVVRAGQHVRIKSEDRCAHNTHLNTLFNDEFGSVLGPRESQDYVIDHLTVAESLPMPVKCDIHPWMKAHWLIIDHPYATVTDKEGRFTIEKLPVGEIEFRIWHERPGYLDRKYVVTVEEGANELEPVRVPATRFRR